MPHNCFSKIQTHASDSLTIACKQYYSSGIITEMMLREPQKAKAHLERPYALFFHLGSGDH